MKLRKLVDSHEIDQVFTYAYSCVIYSTNTLTGETRESRISRLGARDYFETCKPHSGLWQLSAIKYAFTWEDMGTRRPNREVHHIQILCSGISE